MQKGKDVSQQQDVAEREKFALYGFEIEIYDDWRVELNPKSSRLKGDVAFHTPKANRFFVSWGVLGEATKRFKTLDEHRDWNVKRVGKSPDVRKVELSETREERIGGHRALFSHLTADVRSGFMARNAASRNMWSIHLYCPENERFYTVYSLLRDPQEFPDFTTMFNSVTRSFVCHKKLETQFTMH